MTPAQQLESLRRYSHDKNKIVVFKNGSAFCLLQKATRERALEGIRALDIPDNGAGSPMGDTRALRMDDGNTLFLLGRGVLYVVEGHFEDDYASATVGLFARDCRLMDAQDPEIVEWFDPEQEEKVI